MKAEAGYEVGRRMRKNLFSFLRKKDGQQLELIDLLQ